MNAQLKNILKGLLGFFTYFFLTYASGIILGSFGITAESVGKTWAAIISLIYSVFIVLVLMFISKEKVINDFKNYLINFKSYFKNNVKFWLLSLLIMFVSNVIISLIFKTLTSANDQGVRSLFGEFPIYVFLSAVIVAPLTEELVFRQSVRYIFKNKYLFIIISGLLFGFMHILASMETLADFFYIIPYSAPGFAFAYMLYKEDNIFVPVSFHMIHNSLAMILMIIGSLAGLA